MVINESTLRKIIRESTVGILREYDYDYDERDDYDDREPERAHTLIGLDTFMSDYLPDGEIKQRLLGMDEETMTDVLGDNGQAEFNIALDVLENHYSGDYWTPPSSEFSSASIVDDDGLYDFISQISEQSIKNAFLAAYEKFENDIEMGNVEYCIDW